MINVYLGCVIDLDFLIHECVKVKVLSIMCRFAVTGRELWRPTMTEDRCGCLCGGSRQKRNYSVFLFVCILTMYALWSLKESFIIVGGIYFLFCTFVRAFPDSYMLISVFYNRLPPLCIHIQKCYNRKEKLGMFNRKGKSQKFSNMHWYLPPISALRATAALLSIASATYNACSNNSYKNCTTVKFHLLVLDSL